MDRREVGILETMLREDVGAGDITSSFTPNRRVTAHILSNSAGTVSGIDELKELFRRHRLKATSHVGDGRPVKPGQRVMTVRGMSRDLLPVERTALNLLSRMSAVATLTRRYADALKAAGAKAKIVATRKTTPLLRLFEKKAVVTGGGLPHRMGLYDMVLIKDNHLMLFGNDVCRAIEAAKSANTGKRIEIEVTSASDAVRAAECGADMVMFDNMKPAQIRRAVEGLARKGLRKRVVLEVSGGITLENLGGYAKLDVDWISTGKITHSAPNVDFSMEIV
jgi:nicotinate-nucleotide pyrophosphorylase (carboxylating)